MQARCTLTGWRDSSAHTIISHLPLLQQDYVGAPLCAICPFRPKLLLIDHKQPKVISIDILNAYLEFRSTPKYPD